VTKKESQANLFGEVADQTRRRDRIIDFATGKLISDTPEEKNRQIFERRLVEEYAYPKSSIDIEVPIRSGNDFIPKRADIVVYGDGNSRDPTRNAYIIIETKKQDRKDGIDQLQSYINNTTAEFGVWFNGKEIVYLHRLKAPHAFREIPDIPAKGETLKDIGLYQKKDLKPATELKVVFETCHNYIYANEGLLKERVFNEVLKLIFIKMVDEKSASPKCEFRITDQELEEIESGKSNAFAFRIGNLFERVKREYHDVFGQDERINLKPVTTAFVVSQLQRYNLTNTPADVKGTAFQTFVYAHERGERGEFFTPYPILQLAVKMLNPSDNEFIIDPACGSGGFLIQTLKHVWDAIDKGRSDLGPEARKDVKIKYARVYVKGIDINPELARVAKMHMILYDDGHTGIFSTNSLNSFKQINEISLKSGAGDFQPELFDVVVTNPPFGTKGKVTDKVILQSFELGHKWKRNLKTGEHEKTQELVEGQVPDILFIERCLQLLRNGGRMAIVVPDGDLNNYSLMYLRSFIKQMARILAVVSLPQETFVPHGAGTKASILFLQKLPEEELKLLAEQDYPIFMAICRKIGYDIRGRLCLKRNSEGIYVDENGLPVGSKEQAAIDTDIPDIIKAFDEFKRRHHLRF